MYENYYWSFTSSIYKKVAGWLFYELNRTQKKILCSTLVILLVVGFASVSAFAQTLTVSGTVTSSDDNVTMPGVNIVIQGTQQGTTTDADGTYEINTPANAILVFSFTGYITQQVPVNGRNTIDVQLEPGLLELDDVVVTAFGIERDRKALGYSVTEVGGDALTQAREVNLGDALQGRVAGVNVSNIGTGVAGSSRVTIRGNVSLSGNNEPLYVIDGIPIDNTQLGSAGMWGGSDWGDGLTSLNPDDIESINVLKGGTAAALYGSRASNGVVLITTKSGVGGEAQQGIGVELNSNVTIDRFINTYDFQDEYGHGTGGRKPANAAQGSQYGASAWGARLDGSMVYQFDGAQRPYVAHDDNFNEFYRTGYTTTNTVALTGGVSNQSYRLSFSDLRNETIVPNSGMDRQTVSLSTNGQWADRLTVDARVQYSREDVDNRARLSDAPGNANYTLSVLPPSINVADLKGSTDKLGAQADGTELLYSDNIFSQNPWWATHQFENSNVRDRILGSGLLRYDLMDWLYVQGRLGMDLYTSRRTNLEPYGTAYRALGAMNEIENRVRETNFEYLIGFNQEYRDFGFSGLFGGNAMRRDVETLDARGENFSVPFLHTIGNAANRSFNYGISELGINSLFGSVEVSYDDVLFLTGTLRNDWFSTLPMNSNSILYPSVGASFVFSDAFPVPDFITFGKVRASWAEVGGGTDPYQLALNYGLVGQGHQGAVLGRINQSNVPNSSLVPLSLKEYEVGLDLRLFDNTLGIDYAYYHKKTENDILNASISQTSGYSGATVNVGEVTNYGHEFLVSVKPITSLTFNWNVAVNFSYNENKVNRLFQDAFLLLDQEARSLNASSQHRIAHTDEDGEFFKGGYSMIVGTSHMRINGEKVYDADGLPVVDGKLRVLGSGIHPYTGGLQNDLSWRNFNLGFLVDFKFGGDLYTGTNSQTYGNGMHKATLEGRENGLTISGVDQDGNAQTWDIPGSDPNAEGIVTVQDYYGRLSTIAEYFVQDASFIKLRQVTLGYNLPADIVQNTPFSNVSLSLVGRNLWLIYSEVDNVDPESTYNTNNGQGLEWFGVPQTRSFGLNVNVKF
ncbi:SusC/RagA family TonB-linked outer membrane protein [Aliifodinibius sp. S!AR15-10]|uniref:SusC/RagA family TonB-linked outer membrane protein n=1 Tax=Aliifodinibius sp. S!AR15-10 TaxID=2950437 RepID=UPI002861009F|nr:SusC/RagA family TonB-linked outer membrane protein [Aliifodinibius sp. S!AR15-10]MDR8394226.1 SusC/RagA family TonB-linked outer membrane protein [Aliifodinibius sp. S!AR15-10]